MTPLDEALEARRQRAAWVAAEILPHEPAVRVWLTRARVRAEDADELVQEAYCRIAMLEAVQTVERPDAYFFSIVRNLLLRRLRRERIIRIDAIAEIESFRDDASPTPEQDAGARLDYARVLTFLSRLPERCGEIVRLRKIEGWSQKRIAEHFDTTEKAVEKQVWLGVRAIQRAWSEAEGAAENRSAAYVKEHRRRRS
ncbi:MAG: sigma-70 family RNA polymerase sigma factor [Phenylobacterium sp.]|nr:sigma-70 family RNA polymerase sigma factor [Phenylobacterium sp.]